MAVLKNVTSSNLTVAYFLGNGWKLNRWTTNQILFRDEIMSHTTQMSLGFLFATVFDVRCPTGICHWDLEAAGIAEAEFLGDPGRWVPQSRVKGMEARNTNTSWFFLAVSKFVQFDLAHLVVLNHIWLCYYYQMFSQLLGFSMCWFVSSHI